MLAINYSKQLVVLVFEFLLILHLKFLYLSTFPHEQYLPTKIFNSLGFSSSSFLPRNISDMQTFLFSPKIIKTLKLAQHKNHQTTHHFFIANLLSLSFHRKGFSSFLQLSSRESPLCLAYISFHKMSTLLETQKAYQN